MNQFQFKIPEDLKVKIANNEASVSITYKCENNKIYKIVTIDKYNTDSFVSWNESVSKRNFEEWYKLVKW